MKNGFRDYVGSRLGRVFDTIRSGMFGGHSTEAFTKLINKLCNGEDAYLVCHDFYSYLAAQDKVDLTYRDQKLWNRMAILNVARSGKFSSDRTIMEYCTEIWKIEPVQIPHPSKDPIHRVRSFANLPLEAENENEVEIEVENENQGKVEVDYEGYI